mgnify:CR=1 FL=1
MGKLTVYIILMTGLSLLFYFSGLLPSSAPTSLLLNSLLNITNLQNNYIYLSILGILGAIVIVTAGGVLFNIFNIQQVLKVAFMYLIYSIGFDFLMVARVIITANFYIGLLLFAPLLTLWVFVVYDFHQPSGL